MKNVTTAALFTAALIITPAAFAQQGPVGQNLPAAIGAALSEAAPAATESEQLDFAAEVTATKALIEAHTSKIQKLQVAAQRLVPLLEVAKQQVQRAQRSYDWATDSKNGIKFAEEKEYRVAKNKAVQAQRAVTAAIEAVTVQIPKLEDKIRSLKRKLTRLEIERDAKDVLTRLETVMSQVSQPATTAKQ